MKRLLAVLIFNFSLLSAGAHTAVKLGDMDDFEKLLNATFPFVEDMLKKHGDFFPLASAVDETGKVSNVATYDGNEQPLSENLIADLKKVLQKGNYRTATIFYDATVIDPHTNAETNAVIVFAENKYDTTAYQFFYPYQLNNNVLTINKSWKSITEKEIFID